MLVFGLPRFPETPAANSTLVGMIGGFGLVAVGTLCEVEVNTGGAAGAGACGAVKVGMGGGLTNGVYVEVDVNIGVMNGTSNTMGSR